MWTIDSTKILTEREIAAVLCDLRRRARRSVNSRQNLTIFRLATCCGLRVSELCGITLADVRLNLDKPHIRIPKRIAKRKKARKVPLWWDGGTLDDLRAWREQRQRQGAQPGDLFVCAQSATTAGRALDRRNARARFIASCRALGAERQSTLTIHDGRHTFISHALKHRTLAEVQQAAGHSTIATTSVYTHIAVEDDGAVGSIFPDGSAA